jgi:hypothetical protein
MSQVVISQPMFFPWVGMLEQVALSNVYVHYADVQFSKGSFTNRVQVKTQLGSRWLTVPLAGLRFGQRIDEVRIHTAQDWRVMHRALLESAYEASPYRQDMLNLVDSVYSHPYETIAELSDASLMALCAYFDIKRERRFVDASVLGIAGASSRRVLDIVHAVGGTHYVTGHGARHYLDHALFEAEGIEVSYMDYRLLPYPQLHGPFTPYVSALDLVANMGPEGRRVICSGTKDWKKFYSHE